MRTVNTKTVNGIFLNEILDPVSVHSLDKIVLRVQIRERDNRVAQPAVHLALPISPNNGAVAVVLRLRGRR